MAIGKRLIKETGETIRDKLVALADTERRVVITSPATGEYKVIDAHRNAEGNLEYTYDDVAQP